MAIKPLPLWKHAFCYVTLGLLCGWYFLILFLYPTLLYLAWCGSYIAGGIFLLFMILTFIPLKFKHWEGFMYCWIWDAWKEYFDFTANWDTVTEKLKKDEKNKKTSKLAFLEFPHGIFPMGQFLSASSIRDITPNQMICGTGADVVFMFPILRQIFTWIGTNPAKRINITKILQRGDHLAIIPGGIAEMYLINKDTEGIYLKKRLNTIKAIIQEGADIVPVYFFGNTNLFHITNNNNSNSFLAKISRKIRASIVLFYGRNYLPVPLRTPITMITGKVIEIKQKDFPSDEEVQCVMDKVVEAVAELYDTKKPDWEKRPLVIQ